MKQRKSVSYRITIEQDESELLAPEIARILRDEIAPLVLKGDLSDSRTGTMTLPGSIHVEWEAVFDEPQLPIVAHCMATGEWCHNAECEDGCVRFFTEDWAAASK